MKEIDCVYLWVDGEQPDFKRRWNMVGGGCQDGDATGRRRFRDNGELRYSLRSLERYAPWVRRIYIVCQETPPPWLDFSDGRLRPIRHEEIFPDPSVLPTFNSCAIELNLHRLPGLSTHFLYFNDDLFLGRDLRPEQYLCGDGRKCFYFEPNSVPRWSWGKPVHDRAYRHTLRLLRRSLGRKCYIDARKLLAAPRMGWRRALPARCLLPAHVPQLYNRERLLELEELLPEAFEATRRHRLRSPRDLVLRIAYAFFLLKRGEIAPLLLDWNSSRYVFAQLTSEIARMETVFELIKNAKPSFICVNDDLEDVRDDHPALSMWRETMEAMYPTVSSFEKQTSVLKKNRSCAGRRKRFDERPAKTFEIPTNEADL